jgi:hypothetical protein
MTKKVKQVFMYFVMATIEQLLLFYYMKENNDDDDDND